MLALVAVLASPNSHAQPASQQTVTIVYNGRCTRLQVHGNDLTSACQGQVAKIVFPNGRSILVYSAGQLAVSFSGDSTHITPNGSIGIIQPVDTVRSALGGQPGQPSKVTGSCKLGNPFIGPAALNCMATDVGGAIYAEFTTDGKPPKASAVQ